MTESSERSRRGAVCFAVVAGSVCVEATKTTCKKSRCSGNKERRRSKHPNGT